MKKTLVEQVDAQLLFDAGALTEAIVTRVPMDAKACHLTLVGKNTNYTFVSQRNRKAPRAFQSFNGAVQMAERLGFKEVKVVL